MAKNESDDDGDVNKMDEETLGFLDQVRKGKSRYFVLSVKGVNVRSLVIKKKSLKVGDKKEARGGGYEPVFGVVTGKGPEIRFQISAQDGFSEAPGGGKTLKLKKFLEDQTGQKFKPEYEIVSELPDVAFDEEDLNHPLVAKFLKMKPVIAKAIEARPDQQTEIEQRRDAISDQLADANTREQSGPKIDQFVDYLKQLLASGSEPPSPPPAPPQPSTGDPTAIAAKLGEALKKLKPLVDKAIVANPNRKGELHATLLQIAGEIKSRQLDQAKQNITAFATLLKSLLAQQPAPTGDEAVDPSAEFAKRREALEPRLLEAQKVDRDKATKLGAVWDYANEQAQAGKYPNAFTALDRLETAIAQSLTAATVNKSNNAPQTEPRGPVAYGKLLLEWRAAQQRVADNIAALGQAILAREDVRSDPRLAKVREAVTAMPALVPAFGEELKDLIDTAMNAGSGPNAVAPLNKAREVVVRYRAQLTAAATLANLEQFAAKHVSGESDVYTSLDTTLAALEREFAARVG
jgi:hypothetical protein